MHMYCEIINIFIVEINFTDQLIFYQIFVLFLKSEFPDYNFLISERLSGIVIYKIKRNQGVISMT